MKVGTILYLILYNKRRQWIPLIWSPQCFKDWKGYEAWSWIELWCVQVGCVIGCIWFDVEGCWPNPKLSQKEVEGKFLLWFEEVGISLDCEGARVDFWT